MENVIEGKCFVCGNTVGLSAIPVCNACRKEEADNLFRVRSYYNENPKANLNEIAEETGIPRRIVTWYFQNGKIGTTQPRDTNLGKGPGGLSVSESVYGKYIWIQISGKIDSANAASLQKYIDGFINDQWMDIIIDMSNVTFFCSTGIRVVLLAYKTLHAQNGSFRIANPSKNVENVLGMVALDTLLLV